METQNNNINNWLAEENNSILSNTTNIEKLPSLKLSPNVVTEIKIDFSKPFEKWVDEEMKITKKIIPITIKDADGKDVRMNWWLNVKNPVYSDIVKLGLQGKTEFKILQTGTQANTKYVLVK